jgi:hypothetical protein
VQELDIAKWVWSLLRSTVEKLAMAPGDQIEDPEIDECFDWDPSYEMSERCLIPRAAPDGRQQASR